MNVISLDNRKNTRDKPKLSNIMYRYLKAVVIHQIFDIVNYFALYAL